MPEQCDSAESEHSYCQSPSFSPLSSQESSVTSSPDSSGCPSSPGSYDPSSSESMEHAQQLRPTDYPTYKLVGDNLDKHMKPREMRIDAQSQSLHFFNAYAVRDRVNTSSVSDRPVHPDITTANVEHLLPTATDDKAIADNFIILIGRILVKYMPFFTHFASGVEKHIRHEYYKEMSQKSVVVS